ncbi:MAG: NAD(P)/FAD-dependent oxidoreductase [Myxococcota bacterium]
MSDRHDVIIVGGRPAGVGLAIRLARQGRRVLVLDRATFPSPPQVPSCPALHMGTLALLDELGVPEAVYATGAQRFGDYVIRFGTWFDAPIRMPTVHGRAFGYYVDRSVFDAAMWEHLGPIPGVERRAGFRVDAVLREGDRVVGVEGQMADGTLEAFHAPWVVGADGRFSSVARMVGAATVETRDEKASTVYFADWKGVAPRYAGAPVEMEVWTDGAGTDVLLFPLPGNRFTVATHQRADQVDTGGDPEAYYRAQIRRYPWYTERFADADVTSRVIGVKKIGNGYREAAGKGWALLGDAFHYKDPVDAQGIYDALLGGRILAEELGAALDGRQDAEVAGKRYGERARAATHPMFEATVQRLVTELYGPPPNLVVRTVIRWLLTDRTYQERFFRFIGRDPSVDPTRWRPPSLILGAVARGLGRDVARFLGRSAKELPGPVAGR